MYLTETLKSSLARVTGAVRLTPRELRHHCLAASADFLVVGAYPPSGTHDECRGSPAEHARVLVAIPRVALPRKDPVYGADGALLALWTTRRRRGPRRAGHAAMRKVSAPRARRKRG